MTSHELPVKVAINSWRLVMDRADTIFSGLTEEQLLGKWHRERTGSSICGDISLPFTTECFRFWAWDPVCTRTWMPYS